MTVTPTPFRKILIANRGEIALRVIRTARAHGYRTVAVYSSADADARHVQEADQAVCIGAPLPSQSYLSIEAILEAARCAGADAVHPGYGFLAENASFARACRDAGLVFIGPSPEAIDSMGNKAGAKTLMAAAGVPCIPGYQGADQSDERLAREAAQIGFPVMIKAAAGGGGRGMRLAADAQGFTALLRSARSEAQSAFGDPELILERAVIEPRHIEIQVFADRHGQAVHLGERDCSVQRRHQKLIEEAPSPAVDAELRARMGATAVSAVLAIRYEGAGTLEFLLDRQGRYYFMEMNTRLQVEHPVTEAICGVDLVDWQLRVAAGEPLPLTQSQIQLSGHAIEVRLCAEDAGRDFMPQSGTMAMWRMPVHPSATLRVEHAMRSGAQIPPYYDSMIAKIVAHGRNREEARRQLLSALHDGVALGVTTNQAFLQRCLEHPVFAAGAATTAFVAQHRDTLVATDPEAVWRATALAAVLLFEEAGEHPSRRRARSMAHRLPISLRFELAGSMQAATIRVQPGHHFSVTLGVQSVDIELVALGDGGVELACAGLRERAVYHRDGSVLLLQYRGAAYRVLDVTRAASAKAGEAAGDGKLRASMNGRVVAVLLSVGDAVRAGQPVVTLEAMKMEHIHAAPAAGVVRALHVQPGDQVAAHRVLAEIEWTREPAVPAATTTER